VLPTEINSALTKSSPHEKAEVKGAVGTKQADPNLRIRGTVKFRSGGEVKPDVGSRVIAIPAHLKPLRKISAFGLRPGEEQARDRTGLETLERFGGAAATVGSDGDFSLDLPKAGAYYVLVLSKNVALPGELRLMPEQIKLQDYFADLSTLTNQHDFSLVVRSVESSEKGSKPQRELNQLFVPKASEPRSE
jgi:hypothetical protein